MAVQLSDHFTYRKLLAFVLPPIGMLLLTSVYTLVDGLFVSHYVGKTAFAAMNNGLISAVISFLRTFVFQVAAVLMLPLWFGTDGVWLAASAAEIGALLFSVLFIRRFRHRYGYL